MGDFLINNQDHFWLALAGIGAIGTLFVAYRALNTWNKEKKYDLDIENLAICNVAVQYINALRYPASNTGEIKKEYLTELNAQEFADSKQRSAMEGLYIYQSRRDHHQGIFEELLKLREKNWAVYGEEHPFYLFINHVLDIDQQVRMANVRHFHAIQDKEELGDEVFRAIMKETNPIIYSGIGKEDAIIKDLDEWLVRLRKLRHKL